VNDVYFEAVRLFRQIRRVKGGLAVLINIRDNGNLSGFLLNNEGLVEEWREIDLLTKSKFKQAAAKVLREALL